MHGEGGFERWNEKDEQLVKGRSSTVTVTLKNLTLLIDLLIMT